MFIKSIHLKSIRAHSETEVRFDDGINLIVGPNGAGKTNILEAVHILCLSRSFLTSKDRYVLRKGDPFYEVEGEFELGRGQGQNEGIAKTKKVRVAFVPGQGKKLFVGGVQLERMADVVGQFPIVVFSPDDQRLTAEGPEYRRRFLDNIISQSSSVYLDNLIRYRKALKQRNELLQSFRKKRQPPDAILLDSWTQELFSTGSQIIADRIRFVEVFSNHLEAAHQKISEVAEHPTLAYEPFSGRKTSADQVREVLQSEFERKREAEYERGITLVGPHRDEVDMFLDDLPVRRYASQGQHRTFGMAMKLAQYDYLRERSGTTPILLLDDVFDNLDPARIEVFLEILGSDVVGQSITTAARQEIVFNHLSGKPCRTIFVQSGAVVDKISRNVAPESTDEDEDVLETDPADVSLTAPETDDA